MRLSICRKTVRHLLTLAIPIIAGQLGTVMMGFTDTLFIGQLGKVELAASGVANSVFFIVCIIGIGILMATSTLTAMNRGEGNQNRQGGLFRGMEWVSVIAGLVFGGIIWFLGKNFHWFGQAAEVNEVAGHFLMILSFSLVPLFLSIGIKAFCDGCEDTNPGMVIMLAAVGLNALLNWLLIWGHWGFPTLGFEGAAYATLASRVLMALVFYVYIYSSKKYKGVIYSLLRKGMGKAKNIKKEIREILSLGVPSGLQYFFEIGAFSGAAIMMGWLSKDASAAHIIAIQLASVTYMAATGVSAAGSILVGHAFGRGDKKAIHLAGKTALVTILVFMAFNGLLLVLCRHWFIGWFANDLEVVSIASTLLIVAGLFQLSDGLQCVGLGILRGIGDTHFPTYITLFAYWVIGLPGGYLLGFYFGLGPLGVWIALLAGLTFSALLLNIRFFRLAVR